MRKVELTYAPLKPLSESVGELPESFFLKFRNIFLFFSLIFIFFFSIYAKSIAVFACYILFACLGLFFSIFQGRIGVKVFLIIYSISSIFGIFFYFIFQFQYGLSYQGGGSDSLAYEIHAAEIKNVVHSYDAEEIGYIINQPYHNSKGYIYFLALLMRLSDLFGGFHTMIPRLFNANLLALCSVLVYNIANKISLNKKQAINCALITGLFPIMIYTAVQSYRDISVLFILLSSVFLSLHMIERRSTIMQLVIIGLFCILTIFIIEIRLLNAINVASMLCVALLIKYFNLMRISNFQIIFTFILLSFFTIIIRSSELGLFVELVNKLDSSASHLAEGVDRAGEAGLSLVLFNLPIPFKYLASTFYSFITPLPIFYIKDFDWNFLSIGTVFQFLFIPFIFLGIKSNYRSGYMLPILLMLIISFVGYTFGSFTFRHITYIVPFAAIYGAIGYEKYKQHQNFILSLSGCLLGFLIIVYYAIKIIS